MTMVKIGEILDENILADHIANGLVSARPSGNFTVLNYTPQAQFSGQWDDVLLSCRGLIVDTSGNILARPFRKFFNLGEEYSVNIPQSPGLVVDKLDGSLGIGFRTDDGWRISTRGSAESEQALYATQILDRNFDAPEGITPLFEIIYPENRIVVDYGSLEGLVLLGAVDIRTGADIPLGAIDWWDGLSADIHGQMNALEAMRFVHSEMEDKEGVVICWHNPNGPAKRIKIKHPRYVELHSIISNYSEKKLFKMLEENGPEQAFAYVASLPDELYETATTFLGEIQDGSNYLLCLARDIVYAHGEGSRKGLARKVAGNPLAPIVFALADGNETKAVKSATRLSFLEKEK
jgi:RNA ligase